MTTLTQSSGASCTKRARIRRPFGIFAMINLWKQRRALRSLDARALDDIGITADTAKAEAARPIWDVPTHWQD